MGLSKSSKSGAFPGWPNKSWGGAPEGVHLSQSKNALLLNFFI